jgi:hypothetical protein
MSRSLRIDTPPDNTQHGDTEDRSWQGFVESFVSRLLPYLNVNASVGCDARIGLHTCQPSRAALQDLHLWFPCASVPPCKLQSLALDIRETPARLL